MSRTIGIWFIAMMALGFACIYAGDATRGSNLEWFAPASSDMRAQLSPLMAEADAIDAAQVGFGQQKKAFEAEAAALAKPQSTPDDARQQKAIDIAHRADALEQQAYDIGNRADVLRSHALSTSNTVDAHAAGAVAGYADRLAQQISLNQAGHKDPNAQDARSYAKNFLRLPSPGDRWRRLWSLRSDLFFAAGFGFFFPLMIIIPVGAFALRILRAKRLRRVGVPAFGRITNVQRQGLVNYMPNYRLSIRLETGEDAVAHALSYQGFQVGQQLSLLVDPKNRTRAVLA